MRGPHESSGRLRTVPASETAAEASARQRGAAGPAHGWGDPTTPRYRLWHRPGYATWTFPAKVGSPLRSLQPRIPDASRPPAPSPAQRFPFPGSRHVTRGFRPLHRATPRHYHPHPPHPGHDLAQHRPHPRRPFSHVDGCRGGRPDLLLRSDGRRRVEDHRRRHHLDERERRLLRDRLGGRGRGGRVGPECGVGRDGRARRTGRHHFARRRRLPVDRRGPELDPHGT